MTTKVNNGVIDVLLDRSWDMGLSFIDQGKFESREELEKGLQATIRTCKRFHASQVETIENIQKEFSLTQEVAAGYVEKYW